MRALSRRSIVALVAVVLLAVGAAGCSSRAQDAPAEGQPAARVLVTRDAGAEVLLERRVPPDQSAMDALRGTTAVRTAYGGGFVSEMLGLRSNPGAQRDWLFYVDGILADVGARDIAVKDGDVTWWDYRFWGGLRDVWAVVGSWPAPFAGPGAPPDRRVAADPPLRAALAADGAVIAGGDTPWRVRVGAHDDLLRREPVWRRASDAADRAGLSVAIEDDRIVALDAAGRARVPVSGARALVAAVPSGDRPAEGVLLVVAGLDAAAARAAARRIAAEPAVLQARFAVAFDGAGNPLRAAGRSGP